MADNVVIAPLRPDGVIPTRTIFQYNQGMVLRLTGVELPETFRADFALNNAQESKPVYGHDNEVQIPYEYFVPGSMINCWIVVNGADYTVTKYHIVIPVEQRARPGDEEPTPEQQSAIDQAIAALNDGVQRAEAAANGIEQAVADALTASKESGEFDGEPGTSPTISVEAISGGHRITITDADGTKTVDVLDGTNGDNGIGISSIAKTGTSGLVDTYTITYTNGQTTTFTVTNGQDGFSPSITVTDITGGHRVTITDAAGTHTVDVMNGETGQGVPAGGTTWQVLKKASDTDYDAEWVDANPVVTVSGTTPSITALPGVRYVCGEVSTLDITLPASGIVDVVFVSGSTPTVLGGLDNVRWANGFDPTSLEANTTYEINIADGLGVAVGWT